MSVGPLIGIAGSSYVVRRPFGELPVHGTPRSYVEHVVAPGAGRVLLPPGTGHHVLEASDGAGEAGRTAVWADDGVVEGIEWYDLEECPAVGVQWHPELDDTGATLFAWLGRRPAVGGRPAVVGTSYEPAVRATTTYDVPQDVIRTGCPSDHDV